MIWQEMTIVGFTWHTGSLSPTESVFQVAPPVVSMASTEIAVDRLNSWKEIAAYLHCDVRTAIRWEKTRGLPVHRIPGGQRQGVFAHSAEIERWLAGDRRETNDEEPGLAAHPLAASQTVPLTATSTRSHALRPKRWLHIAAGAVVVLLLGTTIRAIESSPGSALTRFSGVAQITSDGLEKQGLLTDGRQLYFGEEHNGRMALVSMPMEGGAVRVLWSPPFNVLPEDVSPDGREVLVLAYEGTEQERNLWLIPTDGTTPRKLEDIAAHSASWSPDGKTIAYANGEKIYRVQADGTDSKLINAFSGTPDKLRWSPDGEALRFLLLDPGTLKSTFWQLRFTDGMKTSTLSQFTLPIQNCCELWSHALVDGNYLLTVHIARSPIWLLKLSDRWWQSPVRVNKLGVSAQGDEPGHMQGIAYSRSTNQMFVMDELQMHDRLIQYDPRSGEFKQALPGVSGTFVDYSADRKWVAYTRPEDNTLWMSRSDGRDLRQLTYPPQNVELPRWSPDGRSIAYTAKEDSDRWRIFVWSISGGAPREASAGGDSQGAPTWSPDGRFLVYAGVECQSTHSCAIRRIDLATGNTQTIPGSQGLRTARWSPDGRYIAALDPVEHRLLLFDVRTEEWRKLATSIDGDDVSWSHDSRSVYASCAGDHARIVRVSLDTGKVDTTLDFRARDPLNRAEIADTWFTIAPSGSIVLRDWPHDAEIYAYNLSPQ